MLFHLDKDNKEHLKQVKISTLSQFNFSEKDLEDIISKNISRVIPENQLMVLFQERPFDEAADIYALDIDGNLYIFELKRWKSQQENILQVLRYGQIFGQYSYDQLNGLLKKYRKDSEIDLAQAHFSYFEENLDQPLESNEFNKEQYFVVVTNGIDADTLNAIKYWKEKGLNIESLPYKIYSIDNKPFIDINTYNPQGEIFIDKEEGFFIVNTNKTWMDSAYQDMLSNNKASAYYDRKSAITNIKKNDVVYLYHTGVGIIARGKATGNYLTSNVNTDIDEEFYIPLSFDWAINPTNTSQGSVAAWEINAELKSGHRFRQTVFSITKEMADVIDTLRKTKI